MSGFGECGGAPSIGQTIVGGEGGKVFTLDFFAYMHYGKPYSALQRWEQEGVVAEAWCANSPEACGEYFDEQDKIFWDIVGVTDIVDCINGSVSGCGWTAFGIATGGLGRLGRGGGRTIRAVRAGSKADNAPWRACRFNSFSGDTLVLMADATTKPIDQVKVGDQVLATDPNTGKQGPRTVTHTWVHQDQLIALAIGDDTVITTEDHPFWNATDQQWQEAQALDPGDELLAPDSTRHTVAGLVIDTIHTAAAYNLTIADIHTYYVLAGNTPVLVHNFGGDEFNVAGDYTGRVDRFNVRGQAYFEVHVFHKGTEVGIYGSNGWIGKHGHSADMRLGDTVENRLKGVAVDEMRRAGRLGQNDTVKGDAWKRPHVDGPCR